MATEPLPCLVLSVPRRESICGTVHVLSRPQPACALSLRAHNNNTHMSAMRSCIHRADLIWGTHTDGRADTCVKISGQIQPHSKQVRLRLVTLG